MDAIRVQGRSIGEKELEDIRHLREANPDWSRFRLSVALAQRWLWCNDAGRLKDMAARTLLLKLHARGLIELPAPKWPGRGSRRRSSALPTPVAQPEFWVPTSQPLAAIHAAQRPVHLQLCDSSAQRRRLSYLLERYHYRGYGGPVGENLQYLIDDNQGRELAVMVFGAAAWKVACRDQFIGWTACQRSAGLRLIANQQRFLILPWIRVPHLASHLLASASRRLSQDWQTRYGHRIALLETFVDQDRFRGTTYRAAGWIHLGPTTGRTRQDRHHRIQQSVKSVWVRPLDRRFRELLLTS